MLEVRGQRLLLVDPALVQRVVGRVHVRVRHPLVEMLAEAATMGINISATSGRVRVIASIGRRSNRPHLPPVTYCSISSTSAPPAKLKQVM